MAQSRNPSERNKVGEKQKKKQAWWESALNAAGDFATGLGETTVGNLSKVGQFGGNLVKGTIVDPVAWAINNPDEVAKTFVSPERANEWIYDNLFAGEQLDRMAQGNAGLADAAIAAMSLLPFKAGSLADDAASAAIKTFDPRTEWFKPIDPLQSRLNRQLARSRTKRRGMRELEEDIRRHNDLMRKNRLNWDGSPMTEQQFDELADATWNNKIEVPSSDSYKAIKEFAEKKENDIKSFMRTFTSRGTESIEPDFTVGSKKFIYDESAPSGVMELKNYQTAYIGQDKKLQDAAEWYYNTVGGSEKIKKMTKLKKTSAGNTQNVIEAANLRKEMIAAYDEHIAKFGKKK
jgi:hypothetical protein